MLGGPRRFLGVIVLLSFAFAAACVAVIAATTKERRGTVWYWLEMEVLRRELVFVLVSPSYYIVDPVAATVVDGSVGRRISGGRINLAVLVFPFHLRHHSCQRWRCGYSFSVDVVAAATAVVVVVANNMIHFRSMLGINSFFHPTTAAAAAEFCAVAVDFIKFCLNWLHFRFVSGFHGMDNYYRSSLGTLFNKGMLF